ncbi:hypothetical protein JCM10450v2_008107 [Rhodotorula kratochvilovae]
MVGTHLLPPNLLKLFAPRDPLPYAKPPGRDPDFPLKSLGARRAPKPVLVAPVLAQIRAEKDDEERRLIEAGVPPEKGMGEGEDQGIGEETRSKAEAAEVKIEQAAKEAKEAKDEDAQGDIKMEDAPASTTAEDKEEGEEEPDAAAKAGAVAATDAKAAPKKLDQPTDAVAVDLCAEEQFQLRRRERERRRKEAMAKPYAPQDDEEICGDPYKTLFVGRLPRDVTEKDLLREFDLYGPIERLRLVTDPKTGVSRGYAFIVYERERDMKAAYKDADGLKMKGKRVLIDVERGRTVKGWKPRRLGGGLGGRIKKLKGGIPAPDPHMPPPFMGGGGYRGGFGGRGGFMGGPPRGGGYMGRGGFGGPPRGGAYMGGGGGGGPPMGYPPRNFGAPPPGGPSNYGAPPSAPARGGFSGGGIGHSGMRGAPPAGNFGAMGAPSFAPGAGGDGGYGARAGPGGGMGEKRPFAEGPGGGGPPGGPGGGQGYGGGYGGGDEKRLRY